MIVTGAAGHLGRLVAEAFRMIAFDNRDTGDSGRVFLPYSVAQMAEDALAVLDAAQVSRAHVYGISLGSLIAQELALRHPERLCALVLGASSAGGYAAYKPSPSSPAQTFLVRAGAMAPEEAEWAAVPYTYGERTRREHPERIAEDIAHRMASPPERIPSAQPRLWPDAGHMFTIDEPEADVEIARFLRSHSDASGPRARPCRT